MNVAKGLKGTLESKGLTLTLLVIRIIKMNKQQKDKRNHFEVETIISKYSPESNIKRNLMRIW